MKPENKGEAMRTSRYLLLVLVALFAVVTTFALAQGPGRAGRMYDPSTETTVQGMVEKVTEIAGRRGWPGTHLALRTENGTYDVHVGPSDYVSTNGFVFAAGDQIEVTGSKVKLAGADTMIAREIKKDGKVLTLRNRQGIPNWSGGRRRIS
jgi:hypothetical protein